MGKIYFDFSTDCYYMEKKKGKNEISNATSFNNWLRQRTTTTSMSMKWLRVSISICVCHLTFQASDSRALKKETKTKQRQKLKWEMGESKEQRKLYMRKQNNDTYTTIRDCTHFSWKNQYIVCVRVSVFNFVVIQNECMFINFLSYFFPFVFLSCSHHASNILLRILSLFWCWIFIMLFFLSTHSFHLFRCDLNVCYLLFMIIASFFSRCVLSNFSFLLYFIFLFASCSTMQINFPFSAGALCVRVYVCCSHYVRLHNMCKRRTWAKENFFAQLAKANMKHIHTHTHRARK